MGLQLPRSQANMQIMYILLHGVFAGNKLAAWTVQRHSSLVNSPLPGNLLLRSKEGERQDSRGKRERKRERKRMGEREREIEKRGRERE
jgi:hypothetical protein